MEDILTRFVGDLLGRLTGPLTLRLFLQPAVAGFFAVRDGVKDAREGRPFHFWRMVTGPSDARVRRVKETWRAVSKVFVMAVAFDVVYQWLALPRIYPIESVVTATILAIIPYVALRGVTNRIVRWRMANQAGRSGKVMTILLAACLAARGESLAAFDRRCIPGGCVAPPSNTPGILGRHALPAGRLARLGAAPDFHHGLLSLVTQPDHDRRRAEYPTRGSTRVRHRNHR